MSKGSVNEEKREFVLTVLNGLIGYWNEAERFYEHVKYWDIDDKFLDWMIELMTEELNNVTIKTAISRKIEESKNQLESIKDGSWSV